MSLWTSPNLPYEQALPDGAAVEMRRYFGGRADYALLGATPADRSSIESAPPDAVPVKSTALPRWVHIGLPDEYRGAVNRALALDAFPPMRIVVAAHHEVDSSEVAFYDTTKLLGALMADRGALDGLADHEIAAIARAAIRDSPYNR